MVEKNIVLIGFMGTGKTTVGRMLAARLGRDFLDMDDVIERESGKTIPEIFAEEGEQAFRQLERDITIDYCRNTTGKVISLGGGAYMQPAIRDACLADCSVVALELSWPAWLARSEELKEGRPLLQNKSTEAVRELFEKRSRVYADCTYQLLTDGLSPQDVTDAIINWYKESGF
ncbi:shikimate kinase [Bacillus piscicola]|uniref:shikimate kinase n=1 Tax=Bacillus piscicola TaxID=1632684 RepID=UPI001F08D0E4|nr:shikimate kinase [Bacillus piscicola]